MTDRCQSSSIEEWKKLHVDFSSEFIPPILVLGRELSLERERFPVRRLLCFYSYVEILSLGQVVEHFVVSHFWGEKNEKKKKKLL